MVFSAPAIGADENAEPAPSVHAGLWDFENVEINPSPAVTSGRLENGLRYAIFPHSAPAGRISLRLLVTVGSLDENDHERGYAHFVEHMAFNGTKSFPAGELLKFLQRHGVAFGPHVNATTTHTHTLYKLELPDNSPATLDTGLSIFRDVADGILFDPVEVKRERGVVVSEERSRHTPEEAERLALTELLYRGTRIPDRQPIGLIKQIERADAPALRKFYDAWYRPENMAIVIVGDIDAAQAAALIREQFASLAARGPARARPDVCNIEPPIEPLVATYGRQENGFRLSLIKLTRSPDLLSTWGEQLEALRLRSAFAMLNRRLERLKQADNRMVSGAAAIAEVEFNQFRKLAVNLSSNIDDWEKTVTVAEQEVRRVIEHGFTPEELAYQQASLHAALVAANQSFSTLPSTELAQTITDALEDNLPFILVNESMPMLTAMNDRLTAMECQRIFREYWDESAPRIFVTTAAAQLPTAEKIRTTFAASQNVNVTAPVPIAPTVFGYEDFGPAGTVIEKTHVEDLDLWLVHFANGVRLNLKRTPFEKGLARFNVRIGTGNLSGPPDKPGLRLWAAAWLLGGVGKHPIAELTRLLDGLDSINAGSNDDALIISGNARAEHLPRALRELTAMIADPAFRPEGHRDTAAILHGRIDPLWNSPEGPIQRFVLPFLAGGNPRIGIPSAKEIYAPTIEDVRAWIAPQLASGAIEVAVVGDFELENAIMEVAKTFGALPDRQPKPACTTERKLQFPEKSAYNALYYRGTDDRPSTLEFFWPVRDALTHSHRRRLPMLALILKDRVNELVREKKGATYSASAFFQSNDTFPGYAFLRCKFQVKPEDAKRYGASIPSLAARLVKKGITPDELLRAKAVLSSELKGSKINNTYWLTSVLCDAQEKPQRLTDLRTADTYIEQTTTEDLNALARHYLKPDLMFRYIIEPDSRLPEKK